MKYYFIFFVTLFSLTTSYSQFTTSMQKNYSYAVGDSFEIYVSLPASYDPAQRYKVVYYCDANLKSGKLLRSLFTTTQYPRLQQTIFVGIGHIGNYHELRRRDFILPSIRGTDTAGLSKDYGQIRNFYRYLETELVPSIKQRYSTYSDSNSIMGHSLGGLFAFYCLFQDGKLFTRYFALSPALWVNHYSIYQFNQMKQDTGHARYLYFATGSGEQFNQIYKGTNQARRFLKQNRYPKLTYDYVVWKGKTHNSEVRLSLEQLLKEKL